MASEIQLPMDGYNKPSTIRGGGFLINIVLLALKALLREKKKKDGEIESIWYSTEYFYLFNILQGRFQELQYCKALRYSGYWRSPTK